MTATAPKICLTANTTWYLYNFRGRLITSLLERGYAVTAFSPTDAYVSRIEALGARHFPLEIVNLGTNPFRELLTVLHIARTLVRIRPAAVLTYTPKLNIYASLAALPLGIPVIANVSGLGQAFARGSPVAWISRKLYSVALRHPAKVFFQNETDRAQFVRSGLVHPLKADRLPGSGVDVERFRPRPRNPNSSPFTFLLVARLLADKGVREYVEAARRVKQHSPQTQFQLLGFLEPKAQNGISKAEVEAWDAQGLVRYLGATDDVAQVLSRADCVVLPSYYREGVPRSLLEAASMGLPVITTDLPGCRDTVDDGVSGLLCRARDAQSLADCMVRMLSVPEVERVAMGMAGRQKILREFDERIVINRYLEALDKMASTYAS